MFKQLFLKHWVIPVPAFGTAAVLGLIVIPVIIGTWGVAEFGLIVLCAYASAHGA